MTLYNTQCCGVQEIAGLASDKSPMEAMLAFCAKMMGTNQRFYSASSGRRLYTHYTFTAAVYDKECSSYPALFKSHPEKFNADGTHQNYGEDFAALITEHKLGKVVTTGPDFNYLVHPDHKVQLWVWTPDEDALKAWHKAHSAYQEVITMRAQLKDLETNRKAYENEVNRTAAAIAKQEEAIKKLEASIEAGPVVKKRAPRAVKEAA